MRAGDEALLDFGLQVERYGHGASPCRSPSMLTRRPKNVKIKARKLWHPRFLLCQQLRTTRAILTRRRCAPPADDGLGGSTKIRVRRRGAQLNGTSISSV